MADKKTKSKENFKEIGDLSFTTYEGSGLEKIENPVFASAKGEVSSGLGLFSNATLAAVKVKSKDGLSIILVGYKQDGDQQPLNATKMVLMNDSISYKVDIKPPIVLEFDKETNSKGDVKGAITNTSARLLHSTFKNHSNLSKDNKLIENLDEFFKKQDLIAKSIGGQNYPKLEMAEATEPKSPRRVAMVKPTDISTYLS